MEPMDRLAAISLESPLIKNSETDDCIMGRFVDRYDFNFIIALAEKTIEAGIKP